MQHGSDRDLRKALRAFLDRFDLYECQIIERVSDTNGITDECRERVEYADIILLVLEGDLRPGVKDEYYFARQLGKEIFPFYRPAGANEELRSFVEYEVYPTASSGSATCCSFSSYDELLDLIESNLLQHLTRDYRTYLQQKAHKRLEQTGIGGAPGTVER
jgi:hypothetical protein